MNTDKKISRREALKRMGFAVMSSAIASSGLLSLASCEQKGVSVSSFILPERVTVFTSPVSWLERTQNC